MSGTRTTVKKWWKSRVLWFNAIMASLTAFEASFNLLQPMFGNSMYAVLAVFIAVVNNFLRVITTEPIKAPKGDS